VIVEFLCKLSDHVLNTDRLKKIRRKLSVRIFPYLQRYNLSLQVTGVSECLALAVLRNKGTSLHIGHVLNATSHTRVVDAGLLVLTIVHFLIYSIVVTLTHLQDI
jgi:hypothetical protein